MNAFLVSTGAVALAEIGDKTQLLALCMAARFRRPGAIIVGILLATLANHALAGWLGQMLQQALTPDVMRWAVGLSFLPMAAWALVPDKASDQPRSVDRFGPFLATLVTFFLVEIG